MATRTSYDNGMPNWIDLSSPDVDASARFYTALFGWDAQDQLDDEGTRIYTLLRQDGKDVAGLGGQMDGMQGAPAIWMTYVAVDDVDAITKKVEAAGGTVMLPGMDVMESGRMGVYADPSGAVFSVWQAREHVGAQIVNEPNSYTWSELMTRGLDAAKEFYREVLGWDYDGMDMGPMGTYWIVQGGDNGVAGLMAMPEQMPEQVPNHWGVYFAVADTDATVAKAQELGAQVVNPPMDVPGVGRMALLHDPLGGSFNVMTGQSAA